MKTSIHRHHKQHGQRRGLRLDARSEANTRLTLVAREYDSDIMLRLLSNDRLRNSPTSTGSDNQPSAGATAIPVSLKHIDMDSSGLELDQPLAQELANAERMENSFRNRTRAGYARRRRRALILLWGESKLLDDQP